MTRCVLVIVPVSVLIQSFVLNPSTCVPQVSVNTEGQMRLLICSDLHLLEHSEDLE